MEDPERYSPEPSLGQIFCPEIFPAYAIAFKSYFSAEISKLEKIAKNFLHRYVFFQKTFSPTIYRYYLKIVQPCFSLTSISFIVMHTDTQKFWK